MYKCFNNFIYYCNAYMNHSYSNKFKYERILNILQNYFKNV